MLESKLYQPRTWVNTKLSLHVWKQLSRFTKKKLTCSCNGSLVQRFDENVTSRTLNAICLFVWQEAENHS